MTFFCGFPCLLGLTILLLQTIFAGKKSNEKWKMESTKQIRSIRGQKKQTSSLPFREGPGVGFSPRQARLSHKISVPSVSGVSGVSGVSFRFWTKKTPVFGPNRNKTGVSSVSGVPSVSSVSSRKKQTPNQARSATNQASLRAANQVRSAANPQKRCFKCSASLLPSLQGGVGGRLLLSATNPHLQSRK